jgi:HAMP domain-containing protein
LSGQNIEGAFKALFFLVGLMLISLLVLPFAIQAHKARQQRQREAMALNVLSGDYEGHPVTLFDFHYATRGVW